MKHPARFHCAQKRSSAIVLTLLILVLISVIVLGLLASVTLEKQIAESNYQQRRALGIALLGYQSGVAQLRYGLGTGTNSWDNAYANFATNPPTFFWSVSPGLLTRWSYTQSAPQSNIALFSQTSDAANTNLVNLNRPLEDGSYPIIGGANPPNVSVQFVNVLQNPTLGASAGNPIIGRYAFWIDDESAKINLNVADGTQKYTTNSLGLGSPTEVSLQVLSQGGSPLTQQLATNIVQMARTNSFHSPREILRVAGTTPDLYTNNVFNVTDYSRSPDINIFGQPKMAILPVLGGESAGATNMVINGISLLPENEIYPTPSQLPTCPIVRQRDNQIFQVPWPLAFRPGLPYSTMGYLFGTDHDYIYGQYSTYPYNNSSVLAGYLGGTNPLGQPITWPVFPIGSSSSTSTSGFAGKYSARQLDEIAIQIVSLGSKLISADYPAAMPGDFSNCTTVDAGAGDTAAIEVFNLTAGYGPSDMRYNDVPFFWPGSLSHQWVIGMGRTAKVSRLAISLQTFGSAGAAPSANYNVAYQPPYAVMDMWLEEWLPGSYRGGKPVRPQNNGFMLGYAGNANLLNTVDIHYPNSGGNTYPPAFLPKLPDTVGSTNSFWANQVLTNNQGIDFNNNYGTTYYTFPTNAQGVPVQTANLANTADPDQVLATNWHTPWANFSDTPNAPAYYHGAGFGQSQYHVPFYVNNLENSGDASEWTPGTMRSVQSADNAAGAAPQLKMTTTADGQSLIVGGGIQVRAQVGGNNFGLSGEPDPVPMESIRGYQANSYPPLLSCDYTLDYSWTATDGMTGSPGGTVRTRNIASVIPFSLTNAVPSGNPSGPIPNAGSVVYAYANTADPLVNKFPGDWNLSTTLPSNFFDLNAPNAAGENYTTNSESSFVSTLQDPDSYWVPQADCPFLYVDGVNTLSMLATNTLIPRSARMPNIGYLQYVRTGIIPDDESVAYAQQKGTPFRLLSYAPLSDSSFPTSQQTTKSGSQSYPDWAMLDLLYVPSILYSYGGPYAGMTNLAPFGTYGGATAGRINPNGAVIYTTNTSIPQPNVTRLLPLEATVNKLNVNEHFTGSADTPAAWPYSGGSAVDAPTVAQAIASYIRSNGPLRMPSEICNIPFLASSPYRAPANPTGSRNDLVRQMVGELTTQSNVFSVWTVGQTVQKIPSNTQYGEFEPGDLVLGEVRLHFVVERYLDPGADGIYGNSHSPGVDNVTNSFDDPVDPTYHPFQPKYLYRVIRSEEVR